MTNKFIYSAFLLLASLSLTAQHTYTFFDSDTRVDDAIIFDAQGNLFGSHYSGSKVYKIDSVANDTAIISGLNTPNGLAFDSQGNIFVADHLGGKVLKYKADGSPLDTFYVASPSGLLKSKDSDTILIAAYYTNIIHKLAPDGTLSTFHEGGLLDGPVGMAYDASGQLYVANFDGNQILKVLSDTLEYVAQLPESTGTEYLGFITYARGFLWATAMNSSIIYKIDPDYIDSIWAFAGNGPGYKNGPIDSALFNKPNGITFNHEEDIMYVSEYGSGRIRVIAFNDTLLSVREIAQFEVAVYPNPATDLIQINNSENQTIQAELLDANGRVVKSISIKKGLNSINAEDLNSGVYFLKMSSSDKLQVKRIVVKH